MAIRISRNDAGNCINFVGSTQPAYWNACLSGQVNSEDNTLVDVINDIRSDNGGDVEFEFYAVPYTDFVDKEGNAFANATDCAAYITANANVSSNTGRFSLGPLDTLDFSLDPTNTTILLDNGDAFAANSIRAVANDSGYIDILKHSSDIVIYGDLRVANATIDNAQVTQVLATAVNELNALFSQTGDPSGVAPVITSATTINLTEGDSLNYTLVATNGVGYEWDNIPSGVVNVEGNLRKLIGGSGLAVGTYNMTAKAVNYFGEDSETISLVVSNPPYSNTKSVNFQNQDYLGANASLLDSILGRTGGGSGSGDAWTISLWFKPSTNTNGQTVFYFGASDVTNSGFIEVRFIGNTDKIRLRYGSNNNYVQLSSPTDSLTHSSWNHVLISYDGGTTGASSGELSNYYSRFKIFINGSQQTTSNSHSNYGWSSAISGQNLRVGRFSSGNYMRDNCRVDELAIWGSDQSSNISSIYNSGSTHDLEDLGTPPDHWWRMGDGDTYPNIQDNVGNATFVMYNMIADDIVTDAP